MPVPVGPLLASPAWGTFGLLLSCTLLCMNTQHEVVLVTELVAPFGQVPFWGAGGSPLIWVLVSSPSLFWSNCEFWMMIFPPELVPEYPRALYSIQAWSMVMSHTCRQAPTYMPESLKLLA